MNNKFVIGNHTVGDFLDPYIIAEIGVNHEGSLKMAMRLIKEAKAGGAHAAKFQSYKAAKIASKDSPAYWDTTKEPTESQYSLFQKHDSFEPEDYEKLAAYCREIGIDFLSTPFDLDAVDFLAPLVPVFKIASADITNVPLIRKCAKKRKPLIISTGAASLVEIEMAVQIAREAGCHELALLHCVLNYPTPENNAQLNSIPILIRTFPDCVIGYSDHVVPDATIASLEAAMLLGASILEKHFSQDKTLPGNDHYHAMDKKDLKCFTAKVDKYRTMVGTGGKDLQLEQAARQHARRSIVAACNIKEGETLTEENLITKRPGYGISPLHWDNVVGKKAAKKIDNDELISWDMIT